VGALCILLLVSFVFVGPSSSTGKSGGGGEGDLLSADIDTVGAPLGSGAVWDQRKKSKLHRGFI